MVIQIWSFHHKYLASVIAPKLLHMPQNLCLCGMCKMHFGAITLLQFLNYSKTFSIYTWYWYIQYFMIYMQVCLIHQICALICLHSLRYITFGNLILSCIDKRNIPWYCCNNKTVQKHFRWHNYSSKFQDLMHIDKAILSWHLLLE